MAAPVAAAAAGTTAVKTGGSNSGKVKACLGIGSLASAQLDILQSLVGKHLADPAEADNFAHDDYTKTSFERGIPRYEHPHLVAALDILLMYQANRRGQCCLCSCRRSFKHDPRTRFVELLKRWLTANAMNPNVGEDEVRRMCGLVRDLMNHSQMFPSRNTRSFMHTTAEVYEHLKMQLREVLQRDRTCAELAGRVSILSRNLISDALAYLLLAATDLHRTDELPSLEVVSLWQSLPAESNPLPRRADVAQQAIMRDAWLTHCGSLIAALLSMRWAFRIFDGKGAEEEASAVFALRDKSPGTGAAKDIEGSPSSRKSDTSSPGGDVLALIAHVKHEFKKKNFSSSGLVGAFREPGPNQGREEYLNAVEALYDLIYFLGEVFVQFQRISDGLGDYGMIRVSPWLHPFLDALIEKVGRLKASLEGLREAVDNELVLAKAKGRKVKKPVPTEYMTGRAHAAIERVIVSKDCHATLLLQTLEELKTRSAPERLPHVIEGVSNACKSLQNVLASQQFRARVGDAFPPVQSIDEPTGPAAPAAPAAVLGKKEGPKALTDSPGFVEVEKIDS